MHGCIYDNIIMIVFETFEKVLLFVKIMFSSENGFINHNLFENSTKNCFMHIVYKIFDLD